MSKYIRTLTLIFDFEIDNHEVTNLRGAVVNAIGSAANTLFHNHVNEKSLRYSYPLIQYKRQGSKACIVAVEQGADIVGQFLASGKSFLKIGEREVTFQVEHLRPSRILVQLWESQFHYRLSRWVALNSKNYLQYNSTTDPNEHKALLERILRANLLAMLKGLGIWLEGNLTVNITDNSAPYIVKYKGVELTSFNVEFDTNLSIPDNLGVGKHVSVGFGTIHRKNTETAGHPAENINQEQPIA